MNIVFAVSFVLSIICGAIFKSYKDKQNAFLTINTLIFAISVIVLVLTSGHFISILLSKL